MSADWPRVELNEILQPTERREDVVPTKVYRQIGVKLWGMGAYEREPLDGSQTRYKTLSSVEADDVIVNKIWARNGSVAVVTEDLAGCYGSNEFPTFAPSIEKLLPRWFHWFTKTPGFWGQCDEKSRGTSGKNRIRPERFLEIEIPLPPLDEQRRLVARIEELAAKIEEAQKLRRQAAEEAEALSPTYLGNMFKLLADKYGTKKLGDLSSQVTDGPHKTPNYVLEGIPFVTVKNMVTGKLDFSNVNYILPEDHLEFSKRCKPEIGDVLYSKDGATRGNPCFVDTNLEFNIFVSVALI